MLGCKPIDTPMDLNTSKRIDTPMDPNTKLSDSSMQSPIDNGRYQQLVGKVIYLAHTRPDIAFVVSCVSQFMHAPNEKHLKAVYRILRFLKGSLRRGLFFKRTEDRGIEAYTDVDWFGSINDQRSTSGYLSGET